MIGRVYFEADLTSNEVRHALIQNNFPSNAKVAPERVLGEPTSTPLNDLERKLLEEFGEEIGAPSGLAAENLGIPVAQITRLAKALEARELLEDTGYAMKRQAGGHWDWIDKPKTEGGMRSKPGASTVWKTTPAGHAMLGAQQR